MEDLLAQADNLDSFMNESLSTSLESISIENFELGKSFIKVDSLESDMYVGSIFSFSSDESEYKIHYYLPTNLACLFEYHLLGGFEELKLKIDDGNIDAIQEIVESVSDSFITVVNSQELSYCKNLKLNDLHSGVLKLKCKTNLVNLYELDLVIENENYKLYFQLDDNLNRIFI